MIARTFTLPVAAYAHEVVTLWYRPPEILLGESHYSVGVDIWPIGCIFLELFTKEPLFPGNSEIDQLFRIFQVCGTPNEATWPGVSKLPDFKFEFPIWPAREMNSVVPDLEPHGVDLFSRLLCCKPQQRIVGKDALRHPYFAGLSDDWKAKFQA